LEQDTPDRHGQVFDVSMDKWLKCIEDFTFETKFLSLSREEGAAILRWLRCTDIIGGRVVQREVVAPEYGAIVQTIENRISSCLNEFSSKRGFVKLSSRSPKGEEKRQLFERSRACFLL
jgi:hypothetical protein